MPKTIQITVSTTANLAPPPPPFTGPSATEVPPAVVGESFSAEIAQVKGGVKPYQPPMVNSASPAPLPDGLQVSIDDDGIVTVSGAFQKPGISTLILDVSDSSK